MRASAPPITGSGSISNFCRRMSPRDRADIGLKAGDMESVARQMAKK